MKNKSIQSIDALYREFYRRLVAYVEGRFSKISMFAEEVASDAFLDFSKYRAKNGNKDIWKALKRCARHRAISLIRKEKAIIRGGGELVSFEALREVGFEPSESHFGGNWKIGGWESEQLQTLQSGDRLQLIDQIIQMAIPSLSARESILVRHIRSRVPIELTNEELADELSPIERLRFLPAREDLCDGVADVLVARQIGRSRRSLQDRLCEARAVMGRRRAEYAHVSER